jgi:archaellum biogenesis ATPase FlaH
MKDELKEHLLIEYMLSSADIFVICKKIIQSNYFVPDLKKSVNFIIEYHDKYNAIPTPDIIEAETGKQFKIHQITKDQIKYVCDEIQQFCRKKALMQAILDGAEIIQKNNQEKYGEIEEMVKDALSISIDTDLGLNYFADPLKRLEEQSLQPLRTPLGMNEIDDLMGGGLAKGEILLVCANSGGGKSITLLNIAHNLVRSGHDVAYISLELSENLVAQRMDMMMTKIHAALHQQKHQEVGNELMKIIKNESLGDFHIKRMPSGSNANDIRGFLKEYELSFGKLPDMLIIDYLDLMAPIQKVPPQEIWTRDKLTTEQLKDIGEDYQLLIATASQLNRSALDADILHQGHTAGGISKVNTVDWQIAIIQTPMQKSAGEIMFQFLKSRSSDAVGKTVSMVWDNNTLLIKNKNPKNYIREGLLEKKTLKGLPNKSKVSFDDLIDL